MQQEFLDQSWFTDGILDKMINSYIKEAAWKVGQINFKNQFIDLRNLRSIAYVLYVCLHWNNTKNRRRLFLNSYANP